MSKKSFTFVGLRENFHENNQQYLIEMKRILLFFAAALSALASYGQDLSQLPQLPADPAVRKGKLENGLTYYIRHNDKPADRAEFYLATNVGAIQETPDQDGLAHFLEHMCFNGTKNFPDKALLEYLQGIGAEFGRNINASTGVEQTVYMLNNIPLVRETVVDTCLLILHDYSHFVTCDPEEIDKERGVILEERRTRRNADWRMYEKAKQAYYKGSKYADCSLIGSEENLKTFKPESLVNFYHTWYRPDLQAVIVVGDVDVDRTEAMLKEIFSDIPAAVDPKPKDIITIPSNTEPIVSVITDPEASSTSVEVLWKSETAPEAINSTQLGMTMDIIKAYISLIMSERFSDIASRPDAPFTRASLGIGKMCETCEVVMGNTSCGNNGSLDAFRAFMTEVEKMKRFGFTDDEVSRAKDNILAMYEKSAQGADTRTNDQFIQDYINNFFDNYSYMEPQTEYELAQAICSQINPALLNQVAAGAITDTNMVVIYYGPEKEGVSHPSEQDFLDILAEVKASEIQANEARNFNVPLLDAAALAGSPVKKSREVIYGATEWTLKNGMKVVVLPTDYKKDQVIFDLQKDGGRSLIATGDLPSFDDNVWAVFMMNTGVAEFPGQDLSKMLAGKNVNVTPYISDLRHGISGSASPDDLETALQLMYLYFAEPRFDENEFQTGIQQLKAVLPNIISQPDFIFQTEIVKTMYGNNPRKSLINGETLEKANLATIERVYRSLFNDAAGATLYITGNVDPETILPLVEKYAGSIAKGKKALAWKDTGDNIVSGEIENDFRIDMQTPKSSVFQGYTANLPYSVKDAVMLDAAKYVLDMIYTATLREEEGGTYGAGIAVGMQNEPVERALIQIFFDTNPEAAGKLREVAVAELDKLAENGPDEEQMTKTVENFKKNLPESRISNSYWMSALKYWYRHSGADYDSEYEAAISEITPENIKGILQKILASGNFIEVVMSPEESAE